MRTGGLRFGTLLLLFVGIALPCTIVSEARLWAKAPGAQSKLFAFQKDGRVGFIDPTGKIVIKPTLKAYLPSVRDFADGFTAIGNMGYIDETGALRISGENFYSLHSFSDGVAEVIIRGERENSDRASIYSDLANIYMDRSGRTLWKGRFASTRPYSEGLAAFEAVGKPPVRVLQNGDFTYADYSGLMGYVDTTGKITISAQFADAGPFRGGLARVVLDGYCHRLEPDGVREGTPTTGYPTSCGGAPENATATCRVGFIDRNGRFSIRAQFESARDFSEGRAAVRIQGRWGFIDKSGTTVIPATYDEAMPFSEGLAAVRLRNAWGFVNGNGAVVIPPQFDHVEVFSDSLSLVEKGGRQFYVDRKGRTVLSGGYLEATSFVHGLAAVRLDETRVTYINKSGRKIFEYDLE